MVPNSPALARSTGRTLNCNARGSLIVAEKSARTNRFAHVALRHLPLKAFTSLLVFMRNSNATAYAATHSPRTPSTPQQRSSFGEMRPPLRHLGASYDPDSAHAPRQQQSNVRLMSPQVRRAAVVPGQPSHAANIAPRLAFSFDESLLPLEQQQQLHSRPLPSSRKLLSQSASSPCDPPAPNNKPAWSLGASVYCRFARLLHSAGTADDMCLDFDISVYFDCFRFVRRDLDCLRGARVFVREMQDGGALMLSGFSNLTLIAPHPSHLTPHTSHLTPHTSHLTPHTSHL